LEPMEESPGIFRIGDPTVLRGIVRATTIDKAGNRAVREVDLNPAPPPPMGIANAATNAPQLMPTMNAPLAQPSPPTGRAKDRFEPAVAGPPVLPPPGRQLVNGTHCSLDYALDSPNVSRVEAYATRDGGRTWMRLGDDPDRRSPIEFDLPEDGVYGVTLV